jgi:hypothetical protein
MNFVDKYSPSEKGSFSYKSDKYGRIFSQDEIGKYSAKIKNICERITKSEGVVLIYSEFIDGALIPMALSLEEMGFVRTPEAGGKSLFNPPPPVKAKNIRYAMITGDVRLSPNNDKEVKLVTSENNINGEKIKVILISKTGSEGVDFKFIRQVHILEPWYNMNRIEQIIGRAVRNLSHKDLSFEKQNVELYLYGTLLDTNDEESADLYVYRVAEYKAIKMGRVTRLLKEVAVDCIINHGQTNFTQENMNLSVEQILSDGTKIDDYKVGDVPGTASCDYMSNCNFKCRTSVQQIEKEDILVDTYDESFIILNSEKIIQKIKVLMKENFFYKKNNLISRINFPKEYPYVQIYAALTQLVEDDNEIITDKYGRNGRLINLGEYYLFQPIELNYPNNTIFDNSVPVDYKNQEIDFKIKEKLYQPTKKEVAMNENVIENVNDETGNDETDRKNYISLLKKNYDLALEYYKKEDSSKVKQTDSWYIHCGITIKNMRKNDGIDESLLLKFVVYHIIDSLLFEEKKRLFNYLSLMDAEDDFERYAKEYMTSQIVKYENTKKRTVLEAILLFDETKKEIVTIKFDKTRKEWILAEPEDVYNLSKAVKEKYNLTATDFNNLIGFIDYEKKNNFFIFKVKIMDKPRNKGARCDQAGKKDNISMLNTIIGKTFYDGQNTKGVELCTLEELTMRYYNEINKNGKVWFLGTDAAKIYKF